MFQGGRDGECYGSLLAVLVVLINLSGLWFFIKPLMLFLSFPGPYQSPPLCALMPSSHCPATPAQADSGP